MKHLSRRTLLKAVAGLVTFVSAARALARSPQAFTASCTCAYYVGTYCTNGPGTCFGFCQTQHKYYAETYLYTACANYCYTYYVYGGCCGQICA